MQTEIKCNHKKSKELGYIKWFENAEKRTSRGELQIKCDCCGLYIWSSQYKQEKINNGQIKQN